MSCDVASASVAAPTGRGNGEDSSSAAVNEKPNGNAEGEIYRGRLLQLSHFLTRFQAFYCFKNERKTTITPRDIEEAWKYQFLLHKEAKLLDKKCSLEAELRIVSLAPYEDDDDFSMAENAQVDPSLEQQLGEDLRKIQDEIAKCSERDQQVLSLLQRFEVWTTKDIAHSLLMPDCGCKTLDDASCSCWSKLLNIPGAAYFADRWPLPDPLEKTGDSSGASGDSDKENAQGRTMQQQQKRQSMQRSFGSLFSKIYYQQNVEPKSHSLCSLVVPPNKYTWEEFLRVAHMVALLPDPAARQKAADSPCCGINKLIHQVAKSKEPLPKEKNIYATDYKFSAHDLVALWVRAQHSATAFRHLIKLYSWLPKSKIKELEKRQGRKGKHKSNTSSVDTTDVGDDSYAVFFVGNHKSTKRRVPNETKMIAALVEYFCINQVLITYQFMIEGMAKAELSKKRSREEAQHKTSRPQKRSKSTTQAKAEEVADEEAVDDSEVGLLRACQCFMLRWFAKRNQNLIAMLYESSESPGASESYSARTFRYDEKSLHFFEAYKQANITSSIQKYLKDENRKSSGSVSSSDRFFARIDRRVLCGKYEGKGCSRNSEECQFYAVVNRLLKAWRECIVKDQSIKIDPALLSSVQDDFDRIYKDFSRVMRDEGLMAAAKSLLDDKDVAECENPDEARSTLLLSMPAPWRDTSCATCKLSLKKHSPQTVTVLRCNVCERIFDERCCPEKDFRSVKIKELLLHANDMLQLNLFPTEVPVSDSNPDFRGPNASKIAWTTHVLTIDRKLMDNGRPVGLGMIVRQTEASCGCFEHIITGNTKLFDIYSKDFENEYPFALDPDFQGCVVTAITENSPASNAGVNLGDVLVRVRLLSFVDGFEPPEQRDYKLKDEDKQQRVSLFKLPCTKFEVTVKRPSSNLLDSATKWVNELREYNRASSMELLERRLFVCKSCQAEQLNLENEDAATKILKEARYCRSILRRISLESYSRKFHLEEALVDKTFEGVPSLHQMYVSLSRLDSMMEYIILSAEDLARTEQISGAADKKLLRRSFYLPEWTGRNEERLAWAPEHLEKQPGELLCRGVFFLCRSHSNDQENASGGSGSPTREEKYMLFEHFVDLFCSWYLAPLQCVATGPPEAKLTYRRPWIGKICCVCRVRTGTIKEGHRVVCSSDACREILEPSVELTPRRRDKISIYEECSGLVGSTVLLFPGKDDHWLIQLTQKFGFKHNNMPVEYICAGYIPPLSDNCVEDEGEFFLLPIMNERLLQYLLEKQCLPMVRPTKFSQESIWVDWIESSILSVWGMIRVSLTEMRLKVEETCLFLNKIHEDIAARACGRRDSEVIDPLAKDDKLVFISCLSCPSAYCPAVEKSAKDRSAFLHGNAKQVSVLTEILDRQPSRQYRSMVELSEDSREMSRVVGAVDRRELDEISEDDSRLIRVEKSKEGLDRDPEGSSRLQLTAENLCIPPRAGEQLLYTDLYGTSIEEKRLLEDLLPSLPQPALRDAFKYDRETIVLSFRWPSASSSLAKRVPEYSGIGWGFELLKWSEERTLRVGRVHPYSPAAACGLEPNDILLSINGRSTGRGTIWTGASLVAAVLGAPLLVDSPYRRRAMDNIAAMLAYIGSKCERVKGPLILEVARLQQVNHAAEDRYARSNQLQNTEKEVDVVCETLRQGQNNSLASLSDTSNIEGKSSANRTGNNCLEPIQATATECPSKPSLQRTNKNTQASPVLEPGNNEDDEVQILGTQQMIPPPRGDADRKIAVLNAVQVLAAEVSSTLSRRPSITPSGLYRSVEIGKITLTQFECAVYLEAIHAQMYNIGLRLLCPRYSLNVLFDQVIALSSEDISIIPRVSSSFFKEILRLDFKRVEKESRTSPKIFHDRGFGSYGMPTDILPIDRIIEQLMRAAAVAQKDAVETEFVPPIREAQIGPNMQATQWRPPMYPMQPPGAARNMIPVPAGQILTPQDLRNPYGQHPYHHQHVAQPALYPQNVEVHVYGQAGDDPDVQRIRGGGKDIQYDGDEVSNAQAEGNEAEALQGIDRSNDDQVSRDRSRHDYDSMEEDHQEGCPSLDTLPVSAWEGKLVYLEAETTFGNQKRGTQTFLGYVQAPVDVEKDPEEIEEVPVALIHSTTVGIFAEARIVYTDPIGSMLIESNSEKEIEVRKIIKERNQIFRHQLSVVSDGEYLQLRGEMVDNKVERDAGATNSKSSQHKADKSNNAEDPSQGDLESVRANSERLLNIAGYPNSARDQLQNVPEHQGTPSANSGPIHDKAERSNNGQNPLKEASEIFVRSLCKQREGALTPLGTLPDGRDVYFFGCDPEAIYVQAFAFDPIAYSVAEKKFRRITINRTNNERSPCLGKNSSSLCCVWGCTNEATGRCAEFYSETQLLDHIQSFHSWSESDVYRLGDSGRFSRISVRDKIMVDKFIACIKSAALARSSELMDTIVSHKTPPTIFEDPSGQRIICSPVPYTVALNVPRLLHVVQAHGHWSGGLSVFDLSSKLPESVQPMYLLMRLLLLRTRILETGIGEFDEVYSASATRLDGPDKLLEWNAPCCLSRQADGIKECALCALNSAEEVFRVDHGEQDPYQRVRGNPIGCAAAGSVLFSEYEAVAEHDNIPGDLGYAKRLLLGIAKNIPAALRFDWMQNKLSSMMWKDGGSKSFQRHILRSNSVSMLSQAFVVLLSSIKREKLPLWWQTEETGWCNPQRLLVSPTKASLTLNILLFDAALAEFIETGPEECKTLSTLAYTKKDLVPDSFLSLKPEERVDELLRCAERASIPRYDGDHDYFCTTCEEGGYLLCCEFCSTVVHKECCSPPFVEVPKYWVCGPCTVDIMNLSKAGTTS